MEINKNTTHYIQPIKENLKEKLSTTTTTTTTHLMGIQ